MKPGGKTKNSKKLLGIVLHCYNKKLIVRGKRLKNVEKMLNSIVMSEQRKKIGRIYDIFGPVNRPYVVVNTLKGVNPADWRSKRVFVAV